MKKERNPETIEMGGMGKSPSMDHISPSSILNLYQEED